MDSDLSMAKSFSGDPMGKKRKRQRFSYFGHLSLTSADKTDEFYITSILDVVIKKIKIHAFTATTFNRQSMAQYAMNKVGALPYFGTAELLEGFINDANDADSVASVFTSSHAFELLPVMINSGSGLIFEKNMDDFIKAGEAMNIKAHVNTIDATSLSAGQVDLDFEIEVEVV